MGILSDIISALIFQSTFPEDDTLNPFWDAVKLVRAADLKTWDRFRRYDEHDGVTYLGPVHAKSLCGYFPENHPAGCF